MAHAPYVLGEKWARMCAFNRKLLREYHGLFLSTARTDCHRFVPESQYAIKYEETEKKCHFDLADALKRAKQNVGKLFGGIKFYLIKDARRHQASQKCCGSEWRPGEEAPGTTAA